MEHFILQRFSFCFLQILSVNGQSFDYLTHIRALEILRSTTHLSLTLKNNLMGKVIL
jgi:hypothetical protein